ELEARLLGQLSRWREEYFGTLDGPLALALPPPQAKARPISGVRHQARGDRIAQGVADLLFDSLEGLETHAIGLGDRPHVFPSSPARIQALGHELVKIVIEG